MATILIVDDDKLIHSTLGRVLTILGHVIVGNAFDGVQAVEFFKKNKPPPDVVLMDIRMPIMNGIDATKHLREVSLNVVIIFITGDDTKQNAALDAGGDAFMVKPIRAKELSDRIRDCAVSNPT